jgi:vesicle transport through interaction with t-SNAREs protein 1
VQRKTQALEGMGGEARKAKLAELDGDLAEAESLIRRMDLEARTQPPEAKGRLLARLRDYKADLNGLKKDAKRLAMPRAGDASRAELLGDSASAADQRNRLLTTTDRLQRSSDRIEEGKRTILETEELGVSILQDLHQQRQTITHARDTLHSTDDNLSRGRRLISSMARRMVQNKIIMYAIILLLIAAIIFIAYKKLGGHK